MSEQIMGEQEKVKRALTGLVVSDKMDKTVVVLIERKVPHPRYGKYITRSTKLLAHDEHEVCGEGDKVMIQEGRPLSKKKNWVLVKVLEKARQ
jgi:small subunit ribosomal protein S17